MFFCINLVFATSDTRVIKNEYKSPDIVVNVNTNDFVYSDAIIHPISKNNVYTYIIKENVDVFFIISNHEVISDSIILNNFYYTSCNNRNIKIRCLDKVYISGTNIKVVPNGAYSVLKATKRIDNCFFVFKFTYDVKTQNGIEKKEMEIPFRIVSDKVYQMYKDMQKVPEKIEDNEIKRPRKPKKVD